MISVIFRMHYYYYYYYEYRESQNIDQRIDLFNKTRVVHARNKHVVGINDRMTVLNEA